MLRYELTQETPVRPRKLRFGLLSAEEIARMSVCRVTDTMLYYRGLPATSGLMDPLMGTVDRRHLCASCMRDARSCQGHAGHMELAFPVYHIGYVDTVHRILRCACIGCTRVCATDEEQSTLTSEQGRSRLTAVYNAVRTRKQCPHCGLPRPTITRVGLGLRVEWSEDAEWESEDERRAMVDPPFTARDALSVLEHMPEQDVRLLGLDPTASHPRNMIVQNLVVPPPCTRPAIYSSEGSRSRGQNDLTMRLLEILRRSNEVAASLPESHTWRSLPASELTEDVLERIARLQYEVYMLVNSSARVPKPAGMGRNSSNVNSKSLQDRLKGKEGRVRGNLMGKRVDFSARAVITPDAYFECDRVGVPYKIATVLTIPETVNALNITALTKRVHNGATHVHGAKTVLHVDGSVTDLECCRDRDAISLRPGDVVERHLADDDVVVFNRQPSLHMHSMQAHRVRLMPGHTFRLSLPVATPYNADFDGDEMNLHVPQSRGAAAECAMLMGVGQNIVGAQSNRPVMGIVQDSLLGLHLLSQPDVVLDHAHACRLIGTLRETKRRLPPPALRLPDGTARWTGLQMVSMLLPEQLYLEPSAADDASELAALSPRPVVIRAGSLVCGVLRKAHVGSSAGGIVDLIAREYGGVACLRFMGDAQRMTHAFLLQRGHHVGIDDVMLSSEGHARVAERLKVATRLCEEIQREVIDAPAAMARTAESSILRLLSRTLQQTGGIVNEHMSERNAIRRMVTAGSKGSFINLSQICAALGQQSLEGKRIVAEKGTRTLPCYAHNDLSLASRGMVINSFALGLSPPELFFHGIGGREGLVDTAVKTSKTGYVQRKLNKAMEDNSIHQDGTVRNSLGEVISFQWGSDGLHPSRLERATLACLRESEEALRARFATPECAEAVLNSRAAVLRTRTCVLGNQDHRVLLPVHPERLRRRIRRAVDLASPGGITKEDAERAAMTMVARLDAPHTVRASLLDELSYCGGMEATAHTALLAELETSVRRARAPHGESVGCIAAQSIGEPTTQMSMAYACEVLLKKNGTTLHVPIGEIIDEYLPPVGNGTRHDVLPVDELQCIGVSDRETVQWAKITHVSRHPANGDMLTVRTKHGRTIKATASHSFLVRSANRVVPMRGSRLCIGDAVPVVKDLPTHNGFDSNGPIPLTRATGRFVGAIVTNGTICGSDLRFVTTEHKWMIDIVDAFQEATGLKATYDAESLPFGNGRVHDKPLTEWMTQHFLGGTHTTLPAWILDAPDEFVTGLLQAYFDGYGTVQTEARQHCLGCHASSSELVTMLCLCLARYGIVTYVCSDALETTPRITIPLSFAAKFQALIGFGIECKAKRLAHVVQDAANKVSTHIPGMNHVLDAVRSYIPPERDAHSLESLLRETSVTSQMLMRCREHAVEFHAPAELVAELDQAIHADVWWDPIVSIEIESDSKEMVYDFTVDVRLQSFMLSNGVFVHNTLNSFHTAGVAEKNVTLGIPRLTELLDASRSPKTPCTTLALCPATTQLADYLARTLPLTRLGDVVESCELLFDPDPTTTVVDDDAWMIAVETALGEGLGCLPSPHASHHVVRLVLAQDVMRARELTPPIVRRLLQERLASRATVVSSECNSVEWVVRIRFEHVRDMVKAGGLGDEQEAILCHRAMNALLSTMVVSGHPNISHADMSTEHDRPVVHAYGAMLADAAALPCVDWTRTVSNDVWEVYHTLGVEACAHVIFDQIRTVVSFDGTYVDDRHMLMIVDTMLRSGTLMPLNRHGINRTDASPLMRCSFEETTDVLCEAAIFAEHENARGVTTSIMTGQLAEIGTGTVQVLFPSDGSSQPECGPLPRVMRSTCRSHRTSELGETLELVLDESRVGGARPLSPPTVLEAPRKRARFRPVSPPL